MNLALVVGPVRADGKHEVLTVLQRISLADRIAVRRAGTTRVSGFGADTLVRAAFDALVAAAPGAPRFEARIEKRIPVTSGLGGGSSDAATALRLANEELDDPLPPAALHDIAAALGADVPFFLTEGAQLGSGDGTSLAPIELPGGYDIVLALPHGAAKESTGAVYAEFDARAGEVGFPERSAALRDAIVALQAVEDLASLPPNDLVRSPLAEELRELGAFRSDVSGAGPVVYGLFSESHNARRAAAALAGRATVWATRPA